MATPDRRELMWRPRCIHCLLAGAAVIALFRPLLGPAFSRTADEPYVAPLVELRQDGVISGQRRQEPRDPMEALALRDPRALVQFAWNHCNRTVRGLRCVLLRQERRAETLSDLQKIALCYRAEPHSVAMTWLENADRVRRAVYVRGRNVDGAGVELASIEPAGCVARLFVPKLHIAVTGKTARSASRHTLDQAGFRGTFASLEAVHKLAATRGELSLRYEGRGEVDRRPTYVVARALPYRDGAAGYPNAVLILHLDCEWLLPVGIYTYADPAATHLLGSYTMTEVEINPGLNEGAFEL